MRYFCVRYAADSLNVVAGVNNLEDPDAQVVEVRAIIIHEHFDIATHANDVALLKVFALAAQPEDRRIFCTRQAQCCQWY